MKRIVCLALAMFLLGGCSVPGKLAQTAPATRASHIIVTLPTMESSNMTGLPEVEAAVNAITVPEIGVEVEFLTVPAVQSPTEYPSMIAAGKQIDLMVLNNENLNTYAEQQMLRPLDDLLEEYGQQLPLTEFPRMPVRYDGIAYGLDIPGTETGQCAGLWIALELLEEVRFPYDSERIYTFEELDDLFARLKEAYPDAYPLGQITNNYSFSTSPFFLGMAFDALFGSDPAVLPVDEPGTKLVDLYETEIYLNWLKYMRKWYLDGYIYPDGAITTATSTGLMQAGIVLTVPQIGTPYMIAENTPEQRMVALRLSPIRIGARGNTGIFWTIPVTAKEPEAAMKFLGMMYTDERIVNLMAWGIPERDYTLDAPGGFACLEGARYRNPLGVFGDSRLRYEIDGETRNAARAAFAKKAERVNEQYVGFLFDSSNLTQELLEIEKVKGQYLKLLEAGCVDLDTVYPEFVQKLYDAGLQRVIDEKQRQLDLWLAENQVN